MGSGIQMSDTGDAQAVESEPESVAADDAEPDEHEVDTSHLDDVEDGCGCAEVWEHLSDERDD